ncbi:MAG: hypothetical protein L6Q38_06245 [Nitrospira sp.]|nr:hypothetical protein [Nitrospira sp.]
MKTPQSFGRWTVITEGRSRANGKRFLLCLCACGTKREVYEFDLRSGKSKSCGCAERPVKHGKTDTRTHRIWRAMKTRCHNKNSSGFHKYGARGIKVCDRWLNFEDFLSDMGEAPLGMSIERKNNNGNYEPGNCIWATPKQQARNNRRNVTIHFCGRTQCLSAWCEGLGIPYGAAKQRIKKLGWSVERALTTPVGARA